MKNIIRIVSVIGILAISQVAYSNEERDANTAGVATNAADISTNADDFPPMLLALLQI